MVIYSHAAQERYPHNGKIADAQQDIFREAFDRGQANALREAAWDIINGAHLLTTPRGDQPAKTFLNTRAGIIEDALAGRIRGSSPTGEIDG